MTKKYISLAVLLIISMSAVGFGYAYWADSLTVKGEIYTDTLNAAWLTVEPISISDNEEPYPLKDYAWGKYELQDEETDCRTGLSGYKNLKLDVYNAYPGYYIRFHNVPLGNIGTTPWEIYEITVVAKDETNGRELTWQWDIAPWDVPVNGLAYDDSLGPTSGQVDLETADFPGEEKLWIQLGNFAAGAGDTIYNRGWQLEEGDWMKGEIDIYFLQPIEECHHYSFDITIKVVQWNYDMTLGDAGGYTMPIPVPT